MQQVLLSIRREEVGYSDIANIECVKTRSKEAGFRIRCFCFYPDPDPDPVFQISSK